MGELETFMDVAFISYVADFGLLRVIRLNLHLEEGWTIVDGLDAYERHYQHGRYKGFW